MTNELLYKYISGQASREEIQNVREWAAKSDSYQRELSRLKNIWVLAGVGHEIDPEIKEREIKKILENIRKLNKQVQGKDTFLKWLKYAAIILITVGLSGSVGYFLSNIQNEKINGYTEFIVPKGERSSIVLPDGTSVLLNGGSYLKFNPNFQNNKRMVVLKGEAFFDVTNIKSHPFVVDASGMQVEVLGTKFNITSYPDDNHITTFLESGKVKIKVEGKDELILSPSEVVEFNKKTQNFNKLSQNSRRWTDWTRGILTVEGQTIGELAKRLERRFDVTIRFGDDSVKSKVYTGSIKDESLTTVLEALKFASSLTYVQEGKIVTFYTK